jgi:hypothetical protein
MREDAHCLGGDRNGPRHAACLVDDADWFVAIEQNVTVIRD